MLVAFAFGAIALQSAVMMVDELHFHRQRNLPRWERVGHPLDTLTVLVCYAVAASLPPSPSSLRVFAACAVFSCVFVTKDEFVHAQQCVPFEQWLHAVLFMLHPVVLASIALLWVRQAHQVLLFLGGATLLFGVYQVLYWNTPWIKSTSPR